MHLSDHVTERAEGRLGTVLRGRWRLDRVIGVGGMATVYSATHRNKSRVAIKVLHPEVAIDAEVTTRFLREGYAANMVEHEGTVKVLDDDVTDEGAPFLVMELLEGETLDARSTRKGRLDLNEVLAIANQILDVLAAAHDKGIVHRDLKPENLFLTKHGELKILDFGIARLKEVSADGTSTRAGSLLGTPAFMAPEQARGRWDEVDWRTDIWAVGATLFSLLSLEYVHDAETIQEQLIKSATLPARSIASIVPELPPAVVELIDRALAFEKTDRWADARRMQLALRAAAGLSESDGPLTLPTPSGSTLNDATTIVAPPELTSAITGQSYSTTRPVTNAFTSTLRTTNGAAWFAAGGAAILVLVGVAVAVLRWSPASPKPETGPASMPATAAPAASSPEPQPPSPKVAPEAPPTAAPAPSAAPPPVAVKKPAVKSPPVIKKDPPPDKPASGVTLVPKAPPTSNPFDRRL